MQIPEEQAMCECKYDETRDEMDHDDCPFHATPIEDTPRMKPALKGQTKATSSSVNTREDVA
jgi:hypothetical protein